jgi:hypothetical protein
MYDDLGKPTDELLEPWSEYFGPAPEELSSPELSLGSEFLAYQARPYSEALSEFNEYIPKMIPPEEVRSHLIESGFFPVDGSGYVDVFLPKI